MSSNLTEEIQCPICMENLRKPRILSCGHNFCTDCLQSLLDDSSQKACCPICRRPIPISSAGLEGVTINYVVENIVAKVQTEKPSPQQLRHPKPQKVMNADGIKQLKELADSYKTQKNYQKAMESFQMITDQVDGWEKMKPSLSMIECVVEMGDNEGEAAMLGKEITSIVEESEVSNAVRQSNDDYDDCLQKLILKCVNLNRLGSASELIKCRFTLVKKLFQKENRNFKIINLVWVISQMCKKLSKQNKNEEIKQYYSVLDDVTNDMLDANDVDVKTKNKQIAWVLKYIGFCHCCANDWMRSISTYKQAIILMRTAFGKDAKLYRMFGHCQRNLGVAYQKMNQMDEAKLAYGNAIETYYAATDWPSEGSKNLCVGRVTTNLENVDK